MKIIAACLLLLLVSAPVIADPAVEAIRAELRAGDSERAEELAEDLVEARPNDAEAHNVLGEVLSVRVNDVSVFRKMGVARAMRRAWERAVEIDPGHLDAHRSLMRYYLQAPAIAGGDTDKARDHAERIARIDRVAGYRAMAEFHVVQNELPQAVAQYREAVATFPDDLDLAFEYGLFLQRVEDWDTAFAQFSGMIARAPERMDAYYQVGRTAMMSGLRLEDGVAALRHYLGQQPGEGDPSHAWAHTRLGQVYRHMGRADDARREFRAALALEPEHTEARNQLAALD